MEKMVDITWEGKPAKVTVGEISWKDKKDAIRKSLKEVHTGRNMKKESDPILQRELMMLKSIKQAPFDVTLENLDLLSSRDGEKLYGAYSKINELEESDEEGEASSESGSGTDGSLMSK